MGHAKKVSEEAPLVETFAKKTTASELKNESYLWFVARGYVLKGPYSTRELVSKVAEEEISERVFAWRDSYKEWRPLYAIDELKDELKKASPSKKINSEEELFLYPTVPIPGATQLLADQPKDKPSLRDKKVVRVRFNNSRLNSLKKSEVISVFLFALCFSYLILVYGFNKFYDRFMNLWGAKHSGELYTVGYFAPGKEDEAFSEEMLKPLLSAPGLQAQDSHWVAVELESVMDKRDPATFSGHSLEIPIPKNEFLENMEWDKEKIYKRQMRVRGYIDLKNPQNIVVDLEGMPTKSLIDPVVKSAVNF